MYSWKKIIIAYVSSVLEQYLHQFVLLPTYQADFSRKPPSEEKVFSALTENKGSRIGGKQGRKALITDLSRDNGIYEQEVRERT